MENCNWEQRSDLNSCTVLWDAWSSGDTLPAVCQTHAPAMPSCIKLISPFKFLSIIRVNVRYSNEVATWDACIHS